MKMRNQVGALFGESKEVVEKDLIDQLEKQMETVSQRQAETISIIMRAENDLNGLDKAKSKIRLQLIEMIQEGYKDERIFEILKRS